MKTINMPGFTADLSLNRRNDYYRAASSSTANQGGVFPAQLGGILAPGGPDMPGIPGFPDIPTVPHFPPFCYYPCEPICLSRNGRFLCFYPCYRRCIPVVG
jgi:hypothetical protein